MAEIVVSIAEKVAEFLVAPIRRQLGYLFSYHSNVEDLRSQVERLGDVRGRVEQSIDAAKSNGKEIEPDVEKWLKSVDGITKEAVKFLIEDEAKKWCPNLKSRYQLSKMVKKTTQEVVRIQGDGEFETVTYQHTYIPKYEDFESRRSTFKEIMEALTNENIDMIGVYGVGGVGKTMLVKEVERKAKQDKLFEKVVMVVVSATPNIRKIQGEIAEMLGLRFDEESEFGRAAELHWRLKEEKSILVILDDVWGRLDLEEVGIPFGDDHKGCKIVVTSGNQDTLRNEMGIQKDFLVGFLSEQEAWNLFKKMAGDSIEAPDLKPIARKVVKECAGLPIAINTVANQLKNENLSVWKEALQQLRSSTPTSIRGMHANVYSTLESSYNSLESGEAKSLFLLCGIFPENSHFTIQDFLKYGKGLGLFQNINTLEEARNKVHTLVRTLKASCLLLDSDIPGVFEMRGVLRGVSVSVASKHKHISIVKNGVELEEWAKEETLRNCRAISLPYSDIHKLPTGLECPELNLLMLISKDRSLEIPDTFFEGMKQLKVLDLTNMRFSSLPSSLHFLTNLQTLCLDGCGLRDIAIIGELKKLEILSFIDSDIEELPRELGQLTCLRMLDLNNCFRLKVIPSNVIASLSQLEELYMRYCFVQWEVDGNASLAELKYLSHLTTLEIQIPDAKILPKDLLFEKLIRYKILIGDVWGWYGGRYETSRTLKLKLNSGSLLELGIKMLLKRTEHLYLEELNGISSVLNNLDGEGFLHLKRLHVQRSSEIEYVIDAVNWVPQSAFPNLESLLLHNLINLKEICHGHLPARSFCKLRTVEVKHCDRLKNMFSSSMVRSLSQLQEIKITACKFMDEIVAEGREEAEDNNEAMDMLPQLRNLTLQCLPKLMSFFSKLNTIPSIPSRREKLLATDAGSEGIISEEHYIHMPEIISEGKHDIPITLFNKKVAFPCLELLKLSELSKLKHIWHGQYPFESCNLQHLVVEKCAFLLNVVSSNFLQSLPKLETITIESCDSVEKVFDLEGLNCGEERAGLQSHLVELKLIELPRLRCIWNKDPQGISSFQSLKRLNIENCSSLRNLFSPSMALDFKQLQELKIINCRMMEEIVEKEKGAEEEAIGKIVFPQLSYIILQGLPSLTSFYPGYHTFECPSLKHMTIARCPKIKTFISTYEGLQETFGKGNPDIPSAPLFNEKVAFPNLEELIVNFVSLKKIWHYQLPADSFCKLKSLEVQRCNHPLMLMRLQNMESLRVIRSAGSLEYIFDLEGVNDKERHAVRVTKLRHLYLYDLPSLKHIWRKDTQGNFPCQKLTSLAVGWCPHLRNIFTISIVKSLVRLQELSIMYCHMVEEIVEKEGEEEEEATDTIEFPQMTSLTLLGLLQLKSFCHGTHISRWPLLNKLKVVSCGHVEIFALEFISSEETLRNCCLDNPTNRPLFLVDKDAFPNLEEFQLKDLSSMKEIWQGQFHGLSFGKLRVLKVIGCQKILKIFPISLLQNLQNLQDLSVEFCLSLEEVFELGGVAGEDGHAATLPKLRELRLTRLPKLMHLWKKDSKLSPVFGNLTTLEVRSCGSLTHLLPSTVAKSLVQIKNVTVDDCKVMKEIIASEEGEATDETTFSQLKSLKLKDLPNLTSFSSTFSFPSSVKVLVEKCPELKISNGILSRPKLKEITSTEA